MSKTKAITILSRPKPISSRMNNKFHKLSKNSKIRKISKIDNTMTLQTILLSPTPNSKRFSAEK